MKKRKIILLLVLVLVGFIGVSGYYFFLRKKEPTKASICIRGKYTNEELGFQINCPEGWGSKRFAGGTFLEFDKRFLITENSSVVCFFSITINSPYPINDHIERLKSNGANVIDIEINGITAKKVMFPHATFYYLLEENNGNRFVFRHEAREFKGDSYVEHSSNKDIDQICQEVFTQTLNSFKFLK